MFIFEQNSKKYVQNRVLVVIFIKNDKNKEKVLDK